MNRQILIAIVVGTILCILLAVFLASNKYPLSILSKDGGNKTGSICTQEARVCSDGTVVTRGGTECDFTACPSDVTDLMPTSTPDAPLEATDDEGPLPISPPPPSEGDMIACTMDAKQCPDGSYVGRTGPKCEFVCPTAAPNTRAMMTISGTVSVGPTCPVVSADNAASCSDKPYSGNIILTNTSTGKNYPINSGVDGTFTATLTPGVYDVSRPIGSGPFPACGGKIEILSAGAPVPIYCDSGIR